MIKVNQPLSEEQHEKADQQHAELVKNQKSFLYEVAALIEAGVPLNDWQKKWAAGAVRGAADSIPAKRKRLAGKTPKIPDEVILLRQAYIEGGDKVVDVEARLAELYGVDPETLQSRIKRLKKDFNRQGVAPADWGFLNSDWGA